MRGNVSKGLCQREQVRERQSQIFRESVAESMSESVAETASESVRVRLSEIACQSFIGSGWVACQECQHQC